LAAETEAAAADTLHRQARDIGLPQLRSAAFTFADSVTSSAEAQPGEAALPPVLDPFDAILPADVGELQAGERF
jgi:hypothetical protein